jgi:nitrite reductase/ring-hydroxylating ferredoxin subunit
MISIASGIWLERRRFDFFLGHGHTIVVSYPYYKVLFYRVDGVFHGFATRCSWLHPPLINVSTCSEVRCRLHRLSLCKYT